MQATFGWNTAHLLYNRKVMIVPLTPVRCLYRAVDLYGRKIGIVSGDRRFTYAELGERCERLAHGLLSEGIRPGDRVAYLSFNNHQLLEGYYGPPMVHAVAMPLNVRLAPAELAAILRHAEPRMLVFENDFAPVVEQLRRECPFIERFVSIDGPTPTSDVTLEDLLTRGRLERPDIFGFDENEIAELFYTSGSTGTPKGVALSHRTLYLHALAVAAALAHDENGVELHTIPLYHANGWGRPQTATLNGLKQVMVRRFDPPQVLRMIEEEKATGMCLVPTMANALLNCPDLGRFDTSSLRQIFIGGAASSPELIGRMEQAFHCDVLVGYGLTETSPVATASRAKSTLQYTDEQDRLRRKASAGWSLPGCDVRVVDLHLRDVPRDAQTVGEVLVRGDLVMDGYYREPDATRDVLSDGWLHTGDMAVWDEENYIQIVDRKKDIIISGGENISSIEVEKAIFAHPAVFECAVVAAPDPHWGEVPAALIVLQPGQSLTEEELKAFLKTRISSFKVPRIIQFCDQPLPKTGTGKIVKRSLREIFWSGRERRV
ncbi:MAG TPA: long-chain-fatty-acid--CoA ligase [Bryobacteraceae bacterium]|nr:long-chain-fatty-acid--CoA ligase [Bryobacteraceae bacterium]